MPDQTGESSQVLTVVVGVILAALAGALGRFFTPLQPFSLVLMAIAVLLAWLLIRSYAKSTVNPKFEWKFIKQVLFSIAHKYRWLYTFLLVVLIMNGLVAYFVSPGSMVAGCRRAPAVQAITPPIIRPGELQEFTLDIMRCRRIATYLRLTSPGNMSPTQKWSEMDDEVKFAYFAPVDTKADRGWMTVEVEYDGKRPNINFRRLWWFLINQNK